MTYLQGESVEPKKKKTSSDSSNNFHIHHMLMTSITKVYRNPRTGKVSGILEESKHILYFVCINYIHDEEFHIIPLIC